MQTQSRLPHEGTSSPPQIAGGESRARGLPPLPMGSAADMPQTRSPNASVKGAQFAPGNHGKGTHCRQTLGIGRIRSGQCGDLRQVYPPSGGMGPLPAVSAADQGIAKTSHVRCKSQGTRQVVHYGHLMTSGPSDPDSRKNRLSRFSRPPAWILITNRCRPRDREWSSAREIEVCRTVALAIETPLSGPAVCGRPVGATTSSLIQPYSHLKSHG